MSSVCHIDLTGKTIGRWKVLKLHHKDGRVKFWSCKCSCGVERLVRQNQIAYGGSNSCGCYTRDVAKKFFTKHGMYKTKFYSTWRGMHARCRDKNSKFYSYYGGRGIKVSRSWHTFENFMADMYPSYTKHLKKHGSYNTTIERINNNKGYSQKNCTWATRKEQANNTRLTNKQK